MSVDEFKHKGEPGEYIGLSNTHRKKHYEKEFREHTSH
jgi:hypothetical protein